MNRIANNLPERDRFADDAGVVLSEEETRWIAWNLIARTVLISKWTDGEEAGDLKNMLKSQLGTGVLVRNGDIPGILTAGHVAGSLGRGRLVMKIVQGRRPVAIGSQGYRPMRLQGEVMPSSPKEGLRASHEDLMDAPRVEKAHRKGPDIAWIRITEEDAKKLLRYGSIFHNWRKSEDTRDEVMRKQGRQQAGLWACGRIHEKSEKLWESRKLRGVEEEKLLLCAMSIQVFREGPASEPEDGWDRFDYTLELSGRSQTGQVDWGKAGRNPAMKEVLHEEPVSWHGMSGAGIWEVYQKKVDDPFQCSLVGVVYWAHPPNSNKPELKLRAHGIGSISRVLTGK